MSRVCEEICVTVTETVSDAVGEPVDALPPLSESVDTDGLDALVASEHAHDVAVTFSYAGMAVLVRGDATVYVRPQRDPVAGAPDRRV